MLFIVDVNVNLVMGILDEDTAHPLLMNQIHRLLKHVKHHRSIVKGQTEGKSRGRGIVEYRGWVTHSGRKCCPAGVNFKIFQISFYNYYVCCGFCDGLSIEGSGIQI